MRRQVEGAAASLHRRAGIWSNDAALETAPCGLLSALRASACGGRARGAPAWVLPPLPPRRDPCLDLDYCRRLCLDYVQQALRFRDRGEGYTELWYEDVVRDPEGAARLLARFMQIPESESSVVRASSLLRK